MLKLEALRIQITIMVTVKNHLVGFGEVEFLDLVSLPMFGSSKYNRDL